MMLYQFKKENHKLSWSCSQDFAIASQVFRGPPRPGASSAPVADC